MYKFSIPEGDLKKLWLFRENLALGSLSGQVRLAVSEFIQRHEEKIGVPVEDVAEIIEKHNHEQAEHRRYKEQSDDMEEVETLTR